MVNGQYMANPSYSEGRESKLNIIVAGTEDGIVMVEAGGAAGFRSRMRSRPSNSATSAARRSRP